jgi:hypothetical protein
MLIQRPATPIAGKEDKRLSPADSGKLLQNPHHLRTNDEQTTDPTNPTKGTIR